MALFTLHGALKDVFGEAVMACNMSKPSQFPSLESCQTRLLRTHKEVDLHQRCQLILFSLFFKQLRSTGRPLLTYNGVAREKGEGGGEGGGGRRGRTERLDLEFLLV